MHSIDPQDIGSAWDRASSQEVSYVEKALALVLLLVLTVGCFLVLKPFLTAILLAITLCVSTWPLFRRAEKKLGGRSAAAVLMTGIAVAVLVIPLVFLGANVADDIARLNTAVRLAIDQGLPPPTWIGHVPVVGTNIERVWIQVSQHSTNLRPTLAPYLQPIRDWILQLGASLFAGTLQVALGIVLAFFLYRDGAYVESSLEAALTRLGGWRARHVLQSAGATITSVVNGVLGTALIQGALLGLSFWLAGIPGAVVLGASGVVLTLMPLGLAVLWLPAALWLMSQGHTEWAVFVLVWNALMVGNLDNVLRPYLIRHGVSLPTVLIFLGVLGGVVTFGIIGVLIGPVLLAVARTLFLDWGRVDKTGFDQPGVFDQSQ